MNFVSDLKSVKNWSNFIDFEKVCGFILKERTHFCATHAREPQHLFLGKLDYKIVEQVLDSMVTSTYLTTYTTYTSCRVFLGMTIHEVNEENFFLIA